MSRNTRANALARELAALARAHGALAYAPGDRGRVTLFAPGRRADLRAGEQRVTSPDGVLTPEDARAWVLAWCATK